MNVYNVWRMNPINVIALSVARMKILVCGDVLGRLPALLAKVKSIAKKSGQFDMLFCVGSFFSGSPEQDAALAPYISGDVDIPISTFVLGPNQPAESDGFSAFPPTGAEICPNLTYLGSHGVYTTASGLRVAYLSGRYKPDAFRRLSRAEGCYYTEMELNYLLGYCRKEGIPGVDVFLTAEWPCQVQTHTGVKEEAPVGAAPISLACLALKPRYHFAATHNRFFERPPYRNHSVLTERPAHVTRFIALANFGQPDKQNKFLYAFNTEPLLALEPASLLAQPQGTTENPYAGLHSELMAPEEEEPLGFFFQRERRKKRDSEDGTDAGGGQKRMRLGSEKGPPGARRDLVDSCWFCLSSPDVEKHLVVHIQTLSYLALAKGGLHRDHVLALPISHIAAANEAPSEVLEELSKYKFMLKAYFKSKGFGIILYERNFKSNHLQIQAVPVPEHLSVDLLKAVFVEHGKEAGFEFVEQSPGALLSNLVGPGYPYLHVEFTDGSSLLHHIRQRFDIHFARRVLCDERILNKPDNVDWKQCVSSRQEETDLAKTFRQLFKSIDLQP